MRHGPPSERHRWRDACVGRVKTVNDIEIFPGSPYPLGATWDGEGVNFAIFSENATGIELCLVDSDAGERRIPLRERTAFVWHGYVPGIGPRQLYGYRVHGPYEPNGGMRFNPNNLLLDPYARAVDGHESWDLGLFAYEMGNPDGDLKMAATDARGVPMGVVVDTTFDWEGDKSPAIPFHQSVIYEVHVRGATIAHPEVPAELRGKFGGLASAPMVRHLNELGVTAVELLPIHAFGDDKILLDRKLRNYWGYNSVAFFAPETRYRTKDYPGSGVREFKAMVKALHKEGIEVILDVVYNHTVEGNHLGPTLCYKGIDNPTYYRLVPDNPRFYFDYTGTGNSLNVRHPQTLQLIMDSLRYWVLEMHVDGFRFDLGVDASRRSSCTRSISSRASSPRSFIKTRCSVRCRSSPSRGTWARAGTRSATFRFAGPNGTGSTATRSAPSGRARAAAWESSPIGSAGAAISTRTTGEGRTRASTSSRRTTASRCAISSRTTRSTTTRTAKRTATAPTTTPRGTAAPKGRRTIPASARYAPSRRGTSSRAFSSRRGRR